VSFCVCGAGAGTALGRIWGTPPWELQRRGGHLAGWGWYVGVGGGLASRWVLSGVSRGSERRVFASVEPVQAPHLGASGGHLRGEGGT
jgi:hypothetical protein